MIQINKITEVQNYLDGLEAVIFDLDDTLYGESCAEINATQQIIFSH